VAIKKYDVNVSEKEKEAIKNECAILSKLKHPNIITVFGYHYDPFFIVMELMPNGDLFQFLPKNSNLQPKLKF